MLKKSLFFGAAALALLVLLAFVGCSNPASDDGGGAAPQLASEFDYPAGTVFTASFPELQGLLNNPSSVDTNDVTHVAFTNLAALPADLTIPTGKTVYFNGADLNLGTTPSNIIVQSGARLVVVDLILTTADTGKMLVKGTVEIYGTLAVTSAAGNHPAMQVADYYEADGTIDARDTVIGTSRVLVGPGGTLSLTADDIANQYTPNRFTPPQAWAAAGQGDLVVTGVLTPSYTVEYLLEGIGLPAGERTYTITSTQGGGVLPSVIPAGAIITTTGVIKDAKNQTLTVNGSLTATNAAATFEDIKTLTVNGTLIANFASFESVETLKISSRDSDNLPSRASTATTLTWDTDIAYLGADSATLKNAKDIIIGDYGEFASESTVIDLPEGAKISLGRSSVFNAKGVINNSFDNLTSLFIGPASDVSIASNAVTFKSLNTLTLQDGAGINVPNGASSLTFLVEATPSTPPKKTEITWGLNTSFVVATAPSAKVDVTINSDASLVSGSTVTVNAGSKFTVAAGKTLTVPSGARVNLSGLVSSSSTAPTNAADAPIQILGKIELTSGGILTGPEPSVLSNPLDAYKFVAFGDDGMFVLNYGTTYTMGAMPLVGANGTGSAYEWVSGGTSDGAQIVIDGAGFTFRDIGGAAAGAVITVGGRNAYILKEQTLTLEAGVQLRISIAGSSPSPAAAGSMIGFAGDAGTTGGAQLKGPGSIVVVDTSGPIVPITTITGGASGWRVHGSDMILIGKVSNTEAEIANSAGSQTSLRALGADATITQAAGKTLTIAAGTVVELGGTATTAGGSITLKDTGILSFTDQTSKISLGAGTGGTAPTFVGTTLQIGGADVTAGGSFDPADFLVVGTNDAANAKSTGILVQLGGAHGGTLTASGDDVTITSNAAYYSD
jgi:hypothetical protein